jgi:hypothetical protein
MPLSDADLINGDPFQVAQSGAFEPMAQIPLEDVLYGIPPDPQMVGDILDGHMAAKCENIAFKGSGIGSALIGESKLDLAHDLATQTLNPLYGQLNVHRDGTNRYRPKSAQYGASPLHGATVAFRAPEPVLASGNPENNGTFLKKSANILIAVNTESVIQQACGHPICLSVLCGNLLKDMDVHFFQPKVRSFRMNRKRSIRKSKKGA